VSRTSWSAAKLLGGSLLVYAIAAGAPLSEPSGGTCGGSAPIARSGFASAALAAPDQPGARLKARYLEADDGSRQFLGWYDPARDASCRFTVASDGAWRCLPEGAASGTFFADSSCTTPLATVPKGCAAPAYVTVRQASSCASSEFSERVFAIGDRFTASLAYWVAGSACAPTTSGDFSFSPYDLYTVGDEIPASSFVGATSQTEP
jgi:hypothetical protein